MVQTCVHSRHSSCNFIAVIWLLAAGIGSAQTPDFVWARQEISLTRFPHAVAVATDRQNNILVGGWCEDPARIGTFPLPASSSAFLAKHDPAGHVLWAKGPIGTGWGRIYAVATETNGDVLATGEFSRQLFFGGATLTNPTDYGRGMFLAKYSSAGSALWARSDGDRTNSFGNGLALDGAGNAYVTGSCYAGSAAFGTNTLTGPGAFLAKYASDGTLLWARRLAVNEGGTNRTARSIGGISAYTNRNVWVSGNLISPLSDQFTTVWDAFLARLDDEGNPVWVRILRTVGFDELNAPVAVDSSGNAYWHGSVHAYTTLDFGSFVVSNDNDDKVFTAKYGPTCDPLWVRTASGAAIARGATADNSGVAITGEARPSFQNQSLTAGTHSVTLTDTSIYVIRYHSVGNLLWLRAARPGSYAGNSGRAVAVDQTGAAVVLGNLSSQAGFGDITLTNGGDFLAKLGMSSSLAPERLVGDIELNPLSATGNLAPPTPGTVYLYTTSTG